MVWWGGSVCFLWIRVLCFLPFLRTAFFCLDGLSGLLRVVLVWVSLGNALKMLSGAVGFTLWEGRRLYVPLKCTLLGFISPSLSFQ